MRVINNPKNAITGRLIRLDKTRVVFLGERSEKPDTWYVGFRNENGEDTKLMLSREAMDALVAVATEPPKGQPVTFPEPRMEWRVVTAEELSEG